jgi:4-hydroxy-tetrahydrodipicolinate synthase
MRKQLIYPTGSWVALITPSMAERAFGSRQVQRLGQFQASNGTSGLLLMGSTGEPTSLSLEEKGQSSGDGSLLQGEDPVFFGVTCGSQPCIQTCSICSGEGWRWDLVFFLPVCSTPIRSLRISENVCQSVDIAVAI